jgi:hypothetical protein
VYNFWAFLTERLNKLLKNLNSNNWTGGLLEVSMMREFHRNAAVDSAVCFCLELYISSPKQQQLYSFTNCSPRELDHPSFKQNWKSLRFLLGMTPRHRP